jgi:bifunctional non-homologous end joining protein LigD
MAVAKRSLTPYRKLATYRAKRHFDKTQEPKGAAKANSKAQHRYLIQKHAATRLHYDFRLELGGVLKSWAVTRGPSLSPADKRLAVQVEDHPLEYGSFEGTIPEGEYGGGTVMLWDTGTWEPLEDAEKGLQKGKLRFRLHGKRLHGEWVLVRMHGKASEKRANWLLMKADDAYANRENGDAALEKYTTGVTSDKSMQAIAGGARVWRSNRAQEASQPVAKAKPLKKAKAVKAKKKTRDNTAPPPAFHEMQLATLVDHPPEGGGWVHEIKFDGYRALTRIENGEVRMITRAGNDWTDRFRAIAEEAKKLPVQNALIDGEVVKQAEDGTMSFHALQQAMGEGSEDLTYYAFDLLWLNGEDVTGKSLLARKEMLQRIIKDRRFRYSEHFTQTGSDVLHNACGLALEGIISKRADAPYQSGRTADWLKSKCIQEQEFVIGGFAYQPKHPGQLAALLIGYYEKGVLKFAGKVGTGFTHKEAAQLIKHMLPLKQAGSAFRHVPSSYRRGAVWLKPVLVAQVQFTEWTADGMLRHPSYQGLREDKPAADVTREVRKPLPRALRETAQIPAPRTVRRSPKNIVEISGIALTHPDKLLYPGQGITKRQLAEYYAAVAPWMLLQAAGRPISLVRCPQGQGKACFFQRHAGLGSSEYIRPIAGSQEAEGEPFVMIEDVRGLIALVQMGVLEVHCWGSRADAIEKPDRIVFDFDPAPDVAWEEVKHTAKEMRARLAKWGYESFLKTTGGKGLHVVMPIMRGPSWEEVKDFARETAGQMVDEAPERFTDNIRKAERTGKIFIDYLRNERSASAIAPYSTRAKPGAPVALPIDWKELDALDTPNAFTIANVPALLKKRRKDPWTDIDRIKQRLKPL